MNELVITSDPWMLGHFYVAQTARVRLSYRNVHFLCMHLVHTLNKYLC